jgi:thiamine-monophosphate kinase
MPGTSQRRKLSELGEFGLIKHLTREIKLRNKSTVVGVGDDAAVLDFQNLKTVITTDLLMEGIHFDLVYTPLKHLGYKSVIVNLSDIYAMNATPSQILISLAVSAKFTTEMLEELYEGIYLACEKYNIDLAGGDTSSSLTGLTICVTAIGHATNEKLTYRSGAKENNLICVTGDLGAAFMGLQLLEREKRIFSQNQSVQPDLSDYDYILKRQLKPEARKDIIDLLATHSIKPTSMIDISDGLSSEILHICSASVAGCRIYAEKIPIADETKAMAEELNLEPVTISMNGGEDYELLFTVELTDLEKIMKIPGVSVIGHITKKSDGTNLITPDGSLVEISAMGWNSLKEV